MSSTIDLVRGLVTVWEDSPLPLLLKQYWPAGKQNEFETLYDEEAPASQPFPYCIFKVGSGRVVCRQDDTGQVENKGGREQHEIPLEFHVHTRNIPTPATSSKQLGASFVEEVMAVFGGHPVKKPKDIGLSYGSVLRVTYQTCYGARDGDNAYVWTISYMVLVDVPVAM